MLLGRDSVRSSAQEADLREGREATVPVLVLGFSSLGAVMGMVLYDIADIL